MTRNRASAKQAGSAQERVIADYLKEVTNNDDIDRAPRHGVRDIGDIANLKFRGHRIAIEVKDCKHEYCTKCNRVTGMKLAEWTKEAIDEADNYNALAGFAVVKRRGVTDPSKQWVIGTLDQLVSLINEVPER